MDMEQDIASLFGGELDPMPGDERFEMDAEQEVVDGIRALVVLMQQQTQLLQVIAARLGPKRIVKDGNGQILGVEPVQG
jgi:hypothetical protein